jgi:hypothetical protein
MNGTKHNNQKIMELRNSSKWLSRYGDKIWRPIKANETIHIYIHDWWCRFKVEESKGKPPGKGGRHNGLSLFLPEAKAAVQAANKSCMFLQDATPNMYTKLAALPGALHNLWTYVLGLCGESCIEKYYHSLANYANRGMGHELADSLYLCRTTCITVANDAPR